jgi:sialate O-acetylesterase
MQFSVGNASNASAEIAAAASFPEIRLFTAGRVVHSEDVAQAELPYVEQKWSVSNEESVGGPWGSNFSAVCYFFGRDIYRMRRYPIGLVSANWGSTNVETWSSPGGLARCNATAPNRRPPAPLSPTCKHLGEPCTSVDGYHSDECCGGRCFYYAKPPFWPSHGYCDEVSPSNRDAVLWHNIIHPLLKMKIFGAVWYQGESDARGQAAVDYACTFPTMVDDWRSAWHAASGTDPTFPFGFVMLSATGVSTSGAVASDSELGYATLRWSQTSNHGTVPNERQPRTFMSVAVDLGAYEGGCCAGKDGQAECNTFPKLCIHPCWKQEVGRRLSLGAASVAYGIEGGCFQGPMARTATSTLTASGTHVVTVTFDIAAGCGSAGVNLRRTADFDLRLSDGVTWVLGKAAAGPSLNTVVVSPTNASHAHSSFDQIRYVVSLGVLLRCGSES